MIFKAILSSNGQSKKIEVEDVINNYRTPETIGPWLRNPVITRRLLQKEFFAKM